MSRPARRRTSSSAQESLLFFFEGAPNLQSSCFVEVAMLASVRWSAVLWGVGLGALGLGLAALILWLILSAIGVDDPAGAGVSCGTLAGFAVGGLVAGRGGPASVLFHGALAALGIALAVVVTSLRGGSPAPSPQVLLLAALAIVIGGFAGTR